MWIKEPKKREQTRLQSERRNEMDWEEDMVVVAVIVRNEDDRKGEKRVATEFHPVICVVHDPFTLVLSERSLCWSFQSTMNPIIPHN